MPEIKTKKIDSPANPIIKELARAVAKSRGGEDLFMLEGPKLIGAALDAGAKVKSAFFTEEFLSARGAKTLLARLATAGAELYHVSNSVLVKICDAKSPQPIAAACSHEMLSLDELSVGKEFLGVALDNISDPGNMGTIIRTADASGADAVIVLAGACSPFNPKAIRASAGSIFNIPIAECCEAELSSWAEGKGVKLYSTDARGGISAFDADYTGKVLIAFGNESAGVSKAVRDASDSAIHIPMAGRAESLNVAQSSAVILFEAMRQREKTAS